MDRVIEKKTWTKKRILTIVGIAALAGLIIASYYYTSGGSKLNVDTERITISEVKKGVFQETIPVNGIVLPETTIYLDAVEGGRVEEKYVEDGAVMKKGQPILKLSNTDLQLNLVNQETSVYNLLTQMQISRNAAQQNTVNKLNQMTDAESQLKEAERVYLLDKHLYDQKAIGSQEYKKAENDYNYYLQKKKLTEQILKQDSVSNQQQLTQAQQSYEGSQNALAVMREKVGDLIVRAPVDGQLTSLDAEVGQNKNKGERLGQLDVVGGYKVRVDVDEHYISRIYAGLKGHFDFAGKTYELIIKKVYTQVVNGRFQVDMIFTGKVPDGIRRGQTLQILLALSDERQSLLLAKGGFYQQTGGNWIFKVSKDGSTAYKVDIQLGNQNPDYYEVLSGLEPGDKVVTSSYENYGTMQELVLKGK
ncbi:HlyD family efflux transporter periplasmic adaptor subunit [Panacibacter ginsenosidivorans]|uniref:HlyD family efflux transporter periplasmic adaptor subunit n=1 Tax=Panacibacter ginsenosidivorans TaxID=1813871 RepID=A0A5B8V484_9BACT|nr:HlyD family efflux transporter periplasmic adaptor subunit [Panacibacter ginsenosidivorans]QEC65988.1 HlyD family efflux transporter periplasmic adaptor subunit [Panacibacter ginsenosidivorans]